MGEPEDTPENTPRPPGQQPDNQSDSRVVLDYFRGGGEQSRLVTIRNLKAVEAAMACAKLQAEGIRAVVIDSEVAVTNPLVVPYARVQVAESDRAAAEEILARPAPDDAEGEYVKEDWRCPKCHRKTVELLPPSGAGLAARFGCLGMVAVSVLFVASQWMMPEDWYRTAEQFVAPGLIPWVLLGAVVFVVWMFSKRDKRCESCGHEWSTGDDKDE